MTNISLIDIIVILFMFNSKLKVNDSSLSPSRSPLKNKAKRYCSFYFFKFPVLSLNFLCIYQRTLLFVVIFCGCVCPPTVNETNRNIIIKTLKPGDQTYSRLTQLIIVVFCLAITNRYWNVFFLFFWPSRCQPAVRIKQDLFKRRLNLGISR